MNSQCFIIQKWCRIVLETQDLKLQMPRIFTRYLEAGAQVKREGDALTVQLGESIGCCCSARWFGSRWFGFLGSLENERDCYLGVPLESQITNPNQQLTIS